MRNLASLGALGLMAGLFLSMGCNSAPVKEFKVNKYEFPILVEVTKKGTKEPVPKIPVHVDGVRVGFTDKDGKFQGLIKERRKKEVTLSVGNVVGYRYATAPKVTEALRAKPGQDNEALFLPLELRVEATSTQKDYLVWMKVTCEESLEDQCHGMPVMLNDEQVGEVGPQGMMHFAFREVPGKEYTLKIDTPEDDAEGEVKFRPQDPEWKLTLGKEEAEVFLVEKSFENVGEAKKTKRRRRRRSRRRTRTRRSRRGSSSSSSSATVKPDKNSGISLW